MSATMFRAQALRTVSRSLSVHHTTRSASIVPRAAFRTKLRPCGSPKTLALAVCQPVQRSLVRYQTNWGRNNELELAYQKQKLVTEPELVSSTSSIHPAIQGEVVENDSEKDVDMSAGIKSDFNTIVETFTLRDVPKEALYVGLAGVMPYLATSLATVYLSFDIQYSAHHGTGFGLDGAVAEQLLHIIEPIQLGYGASIISFLGAIHWGLEWAKFGGEQGYPRYAIGIVATAVAWPTLLLSAEVGLIAQFLAFTFLYYTDARASRRGWAPAWYSVYRFVLTFIVGASIVASLIGRGQIADLITAQPGPADRMRAIRQQQLEQLEAEDAEEKARAAKAGDDADEEDGDEGEEEE